MADRASILFVPVLAAPLALVGLLGLGLVALTPVRGLVPALSFLSAGALAPFVVLAALAVSFATLRRARHARSGDHLA